MTEELPQNIKTWLDGAMADAARRGLPELEPLLRSLAASTAALRAAGWNESVMDRVERVAVRAPAAGGRQPHDGNER